MKLHADGVDASQAIGNSVKSGFGLLQQGADKAGEVRCPIAWRPVSRQVLTSCVSARL